MSKLYFPNPICEEYNQSWDSFGYPDSLCDLCKDQDKCEQSKRASELSKKMCADPNNRWGKPNGMIPIICIETGERFPSIKDCAIKLGIAPNQISAAITRRGSTHGYTFQKETSL